jgi:uroporphyrinogen decarboxylase
MFYYKITDTTILYLKEKVKSGVDAVQILILGRNVISSSYQEFSGNTSTRSLTLADDAPVVFSEKDVGSLLAKWEKAVLLH